MEWTKEKLAQLEELYAKGLPQDEIRHLMRIPASAVRDKIRELYGEQHNRRRPKSMDAKLGDIPEAVKRRIVAAYDDHVCTVSDIAKRFGFGRPLIEEVVKRAKGVEKLPNRGSPLLSYPQVPVIGPPVTEMQILFEGKRRRRKAG